MMVKDYNLMNKLDNHEPKLIWEFNKEQDI